MKRSATLLALCLVASILKAEAPRPLQGFLNFGLTIGGDTLGTMSYSDGSSDSLKAGENWALKGGVNYTFTPQWSAQASFGMHKASTKQAKGGSYDFDRTFFEGLAFFHPTPIFKFGGGIRKVLDSEFSGSGIAAADGKFGFDSPASWVAEVEWHTRRFSNVQWAFNLRYVKESYDLSSHNGVPARSSSSIDGSHFGLGLTFYF